MLKRHNLGFKSLFTELCQGLIFKLVNFNPIPKCN